MEAYSPWAPIDAIKVVAGRVVSGHGGDDHGLYEDSLIMMELICVI